MVEVFKTNIHSEKHIDSILKRLKIAFPGYKINFDLEDCDNILRVENYEQKIDVLGIMDEVRKSGFKIEILPDNIITPKRNDFKNK